MLEDDVCTFIAASTSHGFTAATSTGGNLFKVPLPLSAPTGLCAHIVEYPGGAGIRTMSSSSPNRPVLESARFQFMVRTSDEGFEAGKAAILSVYNALDGLAGTRLDGTTSGIKYSWISSPGGRPSFLSYDENHRPRFVVNFEALKEVG